MRVMGAQSHNTVRGSIPKGTSRRTFVHGCAFTVLCVAFGCKRTASTSAAATARSRTAALPAPAAPIRPARAPGHGAQVIVDSSHSLAGFTAVRDVGRRGRTRWRDAGSTRMSAFHEHVVERALAQLNANVPFKRCLLDTELRCGQAPVPALQFDNPQTYHGTDAALDLMLSRPADVPRPDANEQDALDPFAITILVTDGFQTAPMPSRGDAGVICAGGADPNCLGTLLAARVRDGYGVWLGRLVMPFAGMYYPERPVDEVWPRIDAHVDDLNRNRPEWNGVQFGARRGRRGAPAGAFRWEGARPLLLIVLTRDVNLGRSFRRNVEQFIRNEETIFARGAAQDVAFEELAPFDGASGRIAESSVRRAQSGGAADAVRIAPAVRGAQGVEVSIRCTLQGVARFPVQATVQRGAAIPGYVDVVSSWRVEGARAPWLQVEPQPAAAVIVGAQPTPHNLMATVDCRRLRQGSYTQTLGIYVDWRRSEERLTRQWFWTDSVETSYEAPEKVYRLRELVIPPIEMATNRRGWLDHMRVTVTRE